MYDIIFVILIYNLYDEVNHCIRSIRKKIDTDNYHFVIVDNGSKNGVGAKLKKKYEKDDDVHVILLEKNIGFAKGNNVGIQFARELGAKYICCLNDDTRLLSEKLLETLDLKYAEYKPAVIGPRVLEPYIKESTYNHRLQNIAFFENKLLKLKEQRYTESKSENIKHFVRGSKLLRPARWIWNHTKTATKCQYQTDTLGLVLYGCCLFFTPVFFEHLNGFNPATFLYAEEELLYAAVTMQHLQTLYTPSITIQHLMGTTTSKNMKKREEAWAFRQKYLIESCGILIDFLKEHQKEIYGS